MPRARTGTMVECLRHFLTHAEQGEIDTLVRLAKISPVTIQEWLKNTEPLGERKVMVMFFLNEIGYEVSEVTRLNPVVIALGRLLIYECITFEECAKALLFDCATSVKQALRVFVAAAGMIPERERALRKYIKEHEGLFKEMDGIKGVRMRRQSDEQHPKLESKALNNGAPVASNDQFRQLLIASFAAHASALLPVAELLVSNSFSADERAELRDKAGRKTIFLLSTALNKLCGENARDEFGKHEGH